MTNLLTKIGIAKVDCGAYRCKDCKFLRGKSNEYKCNLFNVNPITYQGLFANGDAQRTTACFDAETYSSYEEIYWNE